jgi:hypothetical protein
VHGGGGGGGAGGSGGEAKFTGGTELRVTAA